MSATKRIRAIDYPRSGVVEVLDQRLLPLRERTITCRCGEEVAIAIEEMALRGAPLIGVAAAMGIAVEMDQAKWDSAQQRHACFTTICSRMLQTRPTAVNLAWAVERMRQAYGKLQEKSDVEMLAGLQTEARQIMEEDWQMNLAMGEHGASLIKDGDVVLTHCNTGSLATGGHGTALGVIRSAVQGGKKIRVLVDETRPYLQGARLTSWELQQEGIEATLIADSMAAHCMQKGMVNMVIVGADRIAMNGDVANKIGTYNLSILAKEHQIPFYVAAPSSTIDPNCIAGSDIPIEERAEEEITHYHGHRVAPKGIPVYNPAFDVTPAANIAAIITERQILLPPLGSALAKLMQEIRECHSI